MAGNNFIVGHEYQTDEAGTTGVWAGKKGFVSPETYQAMKGEGQAAFDDNVQLLKRLQKARELSEKWDATGLIGKWESPIKGDPKHRGMPGTAGYELDRTLVPIRANNFIQNLQKMRDNSPTGGAVGNVTEAEGEKIESTDAILDNGQSRKAFQAELEAQRQAYIRRLPGLSVENPIDLRTTSADEIPQNAYFRHPDGRVFQNRRGVPVPPRGASPGAPPKGPKYLGTE